MYLDFQESTYDGNELTANYKIKGEFTIEDGGKIWDPLIHTKRIGTEEIDWVGSNPDKLGSLISNWIPYTLRLPIGPFQSGTPISWPRIYQLTGRESFGLQMKENNSIVAGMTEYKGREHVVLSFDVLSERKGGVFENAYLPVSCHLSGYILIDRETGIHSLGNLEARMAIQNYTGPEYYRISNRFSVSSN